MNNDGYGENGMTFDLKEVKELATFLAEIVRQGVTYRITRHNDKTIEVKLTGGF